MVILVTLSASGGRIRCAPNVIDFFLECQLTELLDRKGEEEADTAIERKESLAESTCNFFGSAFNSGGIGNAPMGSHWLTRPDRTNFLGRLVADGEDEVQLGRVRFGELIPRLAVSTPGGDSRRFKLAKGPRARRFRWDSYPR